ncbi:MAG: 50S ribosomal protein L35 [Patescibacteria group bacterium]|nr:50S ribosomal protein L35 [Patescibacteria group bacterium]MDD5490765.1 50S ribosomal protein L35 [Patescibacteria group bacterium]
MKQKTPKAISKRFRVTKNKKVIKRACGQDHFNARETGKTTRNKRSDVSASAPLTKTVRKLLPYS